jgi:regulator of sigma E protease
VIYLIGFIVLLGLLVLAHELGHFLMGKLCKVKIEAFSLGFGKPILKKKYGETEYRLSMIPVGGYVKFLGDDPEKDAPVPEDIKPFTFTEQTVWKRLLIVFAGPAFNFILAVFLFMIVCFVGEPNIAPVIGYIEKGSIAWNSGLKEGDEIVAINGKNINIWGDIDEVVEKSKTDVVAVDVKRGEERTTYSVQLKQLLSRNRFAEPVYKNLIEGIAPYKTSSMIGVNDTSSLAYKAGFKTGDLIVKADSTEIKSWEELNNYLASHKGSINFKVKRLVDKTDKRSPEEEKELILNNNGSGKVGFYPGELFVRGFVKDKSPARDAGVLENDRIVAVNGKEIASFITLQQSVDEAGRAGKGVEVTIERDAKFLKFNIFPQLQKVEGVVGKENMFLLGIERDFAAGPMVDKKVIVRNPFKLVAVAVERTLMWIWITALGLFKLCTGAVSLKSIGGPLMIGKIAGDSLLLGIAYFFRIAAIISINLGIINLVPIPVLDGGHLMFFTYEAITGKPVKEKTIMVAQQVGIYLLITLVVLSFYNDIMHLGSGLLRIFK